MIKNTLIDKGLEDLDISVDYNVEEFEEFQDLLLSYNEKTDLTNIVEPEEVAIKHFLDSMTAFKYDQFKSQAKVVDIGTGAGFPGIPLKLINKDLHITLLDSLGKRLLFLDHVIEAMGLENIETLHMRAEDMGRKNYRESYDLAVSRAVARLNILAELSLPLVKVGGYFLTMKGRDGMAELEEAKSSIAKLGGKVIDTWEFDLWDDDNRRVLILIEKIKPTPEKYPRNYGQIKKRPL